MSLLGLRSAMVTEIQAKIPELADSCAAHGGRFTPGDIKRYAMKSPAVLVACLGIVSFTDDGGGSLDALAQWGAFVVTTDRAKLPRDVGALAIVEALAPVIATNNWSGEASDLPEGIKGDNLYSGSIDGAGVALWAITWRQKCVLGGLDLSTLDDFLLFHADYDLAPPDGNIEAADDIDLPQ